MKFSILKNYQRNKMQKSFFSKLTKVYIIAEIGVNHNGNLNIAREMILAAKAAGADAVKFQSFSAESLVTKNTPKVPYQQVTSPKNESHYEMLLKLELSHSEQGELFLFCQGVGIDFISTPYDVESAKFLNELGVKIFKTASADIVDLPLQHYVASTGKPVIIATGMANLGEVEQVVNIFEEVNNHNLILLHCVSSYPCSDASLNLRAMTALKYAFGLSVGYSDHSEGFLAAAISVTLGAIVIEKHFTLDKNMIGPDHKASSTPEEFAELVKNIRRAECMLGSTRKACQPEEREMANVSRKSLVLSRPMRAGEIIKVDDLKLMRPGTGIPSSYISILLGRRVNADLNSLHQLRWSDLG